MQFLMRTSILQVTIQYKLMHGFWPGTNVDQILGLDFLSLKVT